MDKFNLDELLNYISPHLRALLKSIDSSIWMIAEEIRISVGKPAVIAYNGGFEYVKEMDSLFICNKQTVNETLMLITENSIYAANEKLINGFITLKGGHRAGICGTTVINSGQITAIKNVSSINIRIKREIIGVSKKIIDYIVTNNEICNSLIISPPQCGKTTLLRDIARILGTNHKVSVIDERSEIAAMYNGIAQNDVGVHTDVLDSCPKKLGFPLVIRSMSPEVIIADEIGTQEDIEIIGYAAISGVKIITSAHGANVYDLKKKENFKKLLRYFDVFITLTSVGGTGNIREILRRNEIVI